MYGNAIPLSWTAFAMNRLKVLGCALIASSFLFLWAYVLMAFVIAYNLALGRGTGVDVAGEGWMRALFEPLLGAAPLAAGIYLCLRR